MASSVLALSGYGVEDHISPLNIERVFIV